MNTPIHKLQIDQRAAVRAAAIQVGRTMAPQGQRTVTPQIRQALVISEDGGAPPTCTLRWDLVTPGPNVPGIRYLWPVKPRANDLVYTVELAGGDTWILGLLSPGPYIQAGTFDAVFSATTAVTGTLVFPVDFPSVPVVEGTVQVGSNLDIDVNWTVAPTAHQVAWRAFQSRNVAVSGTATIHWIGVAL